MADPRTQEAVNQIGTLHEARFVLLDGGKRLMFASSFDGRGMCTSTTSPPRISD